jgi:hypothetical protein
MASFPARLHVLLARDAPIGLVIRRGPAKAVCTIGWDRGRDTFQIGQWLRGRIYERRCDLSPDGVHAIYFAMNGKWSTPAKGAWTAISRAPHLKAIALFAKGDCWNGGGLFVDDKTYWLNNGYGHAILEDTTEVTRAESPPHVPRFGGECPGVYFPRLMRDGWTMRDDLSLGAGTDVFEKPLWHGWTLRKFARAMIGAPPGKGVYFDEHELVGYGRELPREGWEWADVDRDRLVWAAGGKLFAARITKASAKGDDPLVDVRELHDFNDMTFEPLIAPYDHEARGRERAKERKAKQAQKREAKRTKKREAKRAKKAATS